MEEELSIQNKSYEILSTMECPICYDVLHPPIRLCKNGHGVCGDCYNKLELTSQNSFPSCPICRGDFQLLSIACHFLEIIYNQLKVKCKYWCYGCKHISSGIDMKTHMKSCKYQPKKCPRRDDENCIWEGPITLLTKHYVENH